MLIFKSLPISERALGKWKTTRIKNHRGDKREVRYPCGPTSLRSVNTNGTITTILFFYWIGAVSQCALSLCNIIYDARRPKNHSLCGSTRKCKTFATRARWKFEGTTFAATTANTWDKSRKWRAVLRADNIPRGISTIF